MVAVAVACTSSMKCIRFDVCKMIITCRRSTQRLSSMKCIRFDVCKNIYLTEGNANANPQ